MENIDFARQYGPWAAIAGGSEGIGSAFADRLAKQGVNLILIARKPGPLQEVAEDIRKRYGTEVRTLSQDLTAPDALSNITKLAEGCEVGTLIYNAGSDTSFGYFLDRAQEQCEKIVTLNSLMPMRLTRHFLPAMAARKRGGILLCSSLASVAGMAGNGVYSSAKAFMNNFAEMLWYEVGKQGVDVLAVVLPGVKTPAMVRLGVKFDENCSEPEDIADEALANLRKGPILDAGFCKTTAPSLRALPRDQVVRSLAAASEAYSGKPKD